MLALRTKDIAQHLIALLLELGVLLSEELVGAKHDLLSELNFGLDLVNLLDDAVDDFQKVDAILDILVSMISLFGFLNHLTSLFCSPNGCQVTSFVAHLLPFEHKSREGLSECTSSP